MRRLIAFEMLTLDGCYAGTDGDLVWAHRRERDAEWDAFVAAMPAAAASWCSGAAPTR